MSDNYISSTTQFGKKDRPCFFSIGPRDERGFRDCIIDPENMTEVGSTTASIWLFEKSSAGTGANNAIWTPQIVEVDVSETSAPDFKCFSANDTARDGQPRTMFVKTCGDSFNPDKAELIFLYDYKDIEQSQLSGVSQYPNHKHIKARFAFVSKDFKTADLTLVDCGHGPFEDDGES